MYNLFMRIVDPCLRNCSIGTAVNLHIN